MMIGELWPQLGEILSSDTEKQLGMLEICSISIKDNDTVENFVKCVKSGMNHFMIFKLFTFVHIKFTQ